MTEFSKGFEYTSPSTPVTTERNRHISWASTVQELTKPVTVIPSSKIAIILRPLVFASKTSKLILRTSVKLPYIVFNLGYEIAKLFTKGLSSIRRSLFVAD